MAEDQVDEVVEESRSFGEMSEREDEGTENQPKLAKDTVKIETETKDETTDEVDSTETETEETVDEAKKDEEEPELTEKGTKADPNPQSRVHQELANEKRIRGQMEQLLASPELLKKFMEDQYKVQVEIKDPTKPEVVEEPVKEYKPEDFENLDDVANKFNEMQKSFVEKDKAKDAKIEELNKIVSGLVDGGKQTQLASKVTSDIDSLRTEKEFDPKSPEFIEGLEEAISDEYFKRDYDQKTGKFKGEHSLAEIGKGFLQVARKARAKGSLNAQTIVKDKSKGKVVTSTETSTDVDTDSMSAENSIAEGVRKMFG